MRGCCSLVVLPWQNLTLFCGHPREATLEHAVLAQLNSPPKEFADAIQTHMKLRRSFLLSQCEAWVKDAVNGGERMHQRRLESLNHEINSRLEKLGA